MTAPIRQGDQGAQVSDLQQRLNRVLDLHDSVTGEFDDATAQAVRRFQRDRGLAADGVVDSETWYALDEAGYALGDRLLWYSRTMMRGDDVRELQHRLNLLGFDCGREDGIFGPLAHAAVAEFQRNVGLEVDGVAGAATVFALRRLRREHQSVVAVRAKEREWLRQLSKRGLVGARILVDPAHGPDHPGHVGRTGVTEATVAWQIASRLAGRLSAQGAHALLSRGPATSPPPTQRARRANEQGVEVVVSVAVNGLDTPLASGCSSYYFGSTQYVSEAGLRLAELLQADMVAVGWDPDCRTHPMTWTLLRETRMPAVVIEPGFLTSPVDEARLVNSHAQETLVAALVTGLRRFFDGRPLPHSSDAVPRAAPTPSGP